MMEDPSLEYIKIQNFKSFKELDIKLNQLNVIIGANAAGKSNFVQIFRFLKDMRGQGLDNAISLQGGIKYLRNFKLDQKHNVAIELRVIMPHEAPMNMQIKASKHRIFYSGATWKFELSLGKKSGFRIIQDKWSVDVAAYGNDDPKKTQPDAYGHIEIGTKDGKVRYEPRMHGEDAEFVSSLNKSISALNKYFDEKIDGKTPILEYPSPLDRLFKGISFFFDNIQVYDFDPKQAKSASQLTGRVELDHDASNLALAIRDLMLNRESRRKFYNLVTNMLPFVNSVGMQNSSDRSVLFTLTEDYSKKDSLPSSLLSDGTINITALIVALYFERKPLTIVEEPERNIHSHLINRVMDMMDDASSLKQIITTTHNPEVVRHSNPEDLLAIRRDPNGYSEMVRPLEQSEIRDFLKGKLEINELYVQNILEN